MRCDSSKPNDVDIQGNPQMTLLFLTPSRVRAGKMKRTRILLADDDPHMLVCLNALLQPDFEVVGAVSDGHSLVEATFKLHPDVIVTDISMPKMNGIEAVRTIRCVLPDIKFIFLTMHDANGYRREARSVGAAA